MRLFIASDIHGSAKRCSEMLERFESEGADRLLLLGDLLYHGPRNPLPEEYDPQRTAALLSGYADRIICVRGNCDAEIDQVLLSFPMWSEYAYVFADGVEMCLSHGHRDVPPLKRGSVYLTGHTHVPLKADEGYVHLNPGSVSMPKEGSARSYILFDGGLFEFKTLEGEVYDSLSLT